MKKNVSILLIVLFILAISNLTLFAEETKYDFRKTNWGMNESQVKATEKTEIAEEYEDGFAYKDKVADLDCNVIFQFLENKLYIAGYMFTQYHINLNFWIDDFNKLKNILIKKYNKPVVDKTIWLDDMFKGDAQNYGTAVSAGQLVYYTEWDTPKTKIWIGLKGDNYQIDLRIIYESKELKEWSDKIIEKETSKNL